MYDIFKYLICCKEIFNKIKDNYAIHKGAYDLKFKQIVLFLILVIILLNHNQLSLAQKKINTDNLFTKHEKEILLRGELITKSFLKHRGTIHTPNTDARIIVPITKFTQNYLQNYEMLCVEKAFFRYEASEKSLLYLDNTLTAYSKLSGMQYYSRTDKKIQPFITESYGLDSNYKRTDDITRSSITPKSVNYLKITDNRFGDLIFRSELYNEGENFILKNVCLQPMEKYFIAINNKEEYQLISFFIYDKQAKGYYYYSLHAMRIRSESFLKLKMLSAENFANRIRGNTVHMAKLIGLNWDDKIKAFE